MEILLHSESYGELVLAPELPCLIVRWHGFANSRNFRFLLNKALDAYRHYAGRFSRLAWLHDTRNFGALLLADQEWMNADWNPRAYRAGIRQVDFLTPANVFGQIAVQQYTQKATQPGVYSLAVRQHASLQEAYLYFKTAAGARAQNF